MKSTTNRDIPEAKWLIIYDHVETLDILKAYWPTPDASGHALITTRNSALADRPTRASIKIDHWDNETGSQFLLRLLASQLSAELLTNPTRSVVELSERLSRHASALAMMGGVIHRREWTLSELSQVYDQADDEFGQTGIGPVCVWVVAFRNLSTDASSLMSVLSFCCADGVPESLLKPEEPADLAGELPWCVDAAK